MSKLALKIAALLLVVLTSSAQTDTLFVYGPGGPLSAMQECAKTFTAQTGIPIHVSGGPEAKWIDQARQNGDLIYGGSEYMLTEFAGKNPGMIDPASRVELFKRRAAILVRPGNPKRILGLQDLVKPGIKLLDVNGAGQMGLWEDIAGRDDMIAGIQKNISASFPNTAMGIEAWNKDTSYDAWITYASWHENLKSLTDIIELPAVTRLFRGTPIAATTKSRHARQAEQFMEFLRGPVGHKIFRKWGWE